jgi:hypothetical protein
MAAWIKVGARKANEIVIFIFRTLQFSRRAINSTFSICPVVSSLSQHRPRAIEAASIARVSARIGRTFSVDAPTGSSSSRRRFEGGLRQGTETTNARTPFWLPANSDFARRIRKATKRGALQKGGVGESDWRPRESKTLKGLIRRLMKERITVTENGKKRTITKAEAIVIQVINKAASGNLQALKFIAAFVGPDGERLDDQLDDRRSVRLENE